MKISQLKKEYFDRAKRYFDIAYGVFNSYNLQLKENSIRPCMTWFGPTGWTNTILDRRVICGHVLLGYEVTIEESEDIPYLNIQRDIFNTSGLTSCTTSSPYLGQSDISILSKGKLAEDTLYTIRNRTSKETRFQVLIEVPIDEPILLTPFFEATSIIYDNTTLDGIFLNTYTHSTYSLYLEDSSLEILQLSLMGADPTAVIYSSLTSEMEKLPKGTVNKTEQGLRYARLVDSNIESFIAETHYVASSKSADGWAMFTDFYIKDLAVKVDVQASVDSIKQYLDKALNTSDLYDRSLYFEHISLQVKALEIEEGIKPQPCNVIFKEAKTDKSRRSGDNDCCLYESPEFDLMYDIPALGLKVFRTKRNWNKLAIQLDSGSNLYSLSNTSVVCTLCTEEQTSPQQSTPSVQSF